jgi:MFS family permease
VLTALFCGLVLTAAFIGWELRTTAPMVPMRLFRARAFASGILASFLFYAAMYGVLFLLPQLLQNALGNTPLGAGLRLLPWTATLFVTAPLAGAMVNRVGERTLVVAGLLMQATGLGWIAFVVAPGISYAALVAPLILAGVGVSMAMPAVQNAVLSSVAVAEMGKASGIFNMARFLGGVFGVALLVATFSARGGDFAVGFAAAIAVAAILSLGGTIAGWWLPAASRIVAAPKPEGA